MKTPASLPSTVARALARVGRRRRAQALVQGACWASLGLAILVVVAPLAGRLPEGSLGLVWLSWMWIFAWVALPLALLVIPPWRRTASPLRLARAVDDRVPETRDSLLVAVDLAAALDAGSWVDDPITRHLARDHIHEASERVAAVRADELLPWSALGRRTLVGPVAAALAAAMLLLAPGPVTAGLERLLVPPGRAVDATTAEAEDDLPVTLVLRNLEVTLEPPAYARREPLVLEGTSGDFRALPGTRVTLKADLPRGGSRATVVWRGSDEPVEWSAPVTDATLDVSFTTPGGGGYRVLLDRGRLREPLRSRLFRVEALPDDPPDLEVVGPPGDLELHPAEELALSVRASDDFELSRLELTVLKDGRLLSRTPLAEVAGRSHHEDTARWSPLDLGAGGGLELIVEAWDNDTVNGPKVTRSRPLDVYVPTPEDHHERVLATKRRLLDQALDLLAELLVANHRAGESYGRDKITSDFDHQDRLAGGFFATARELEAAMKQDRYERREVYEGIGLLTENLARRWAGVGEVVETRVRYAEGALIPVSTVALLVTARRDAVRELEQIVLDLSVFIDLQVGDRIAAEMAQLDEGLADMADLLRQAEDGKPVDEQLARALEELERQLLELSQELGKRSRGPQDGFANQLPKDLGQDLLSELRQMIEEGRHAEATERLQEAMESLAEMREGLREESEEFAGGQLATQLDAQMADAIARADELVQEQEGVIAATEELEGRVGGGEAFDEDEASELLRDMERLEEMIEEVLPAEMEPAARGAVRPSLRSARAAAEQMRSEFAEGDRDMAIEFGAGAGAWLDEAAEDVDQVDEAGFDAGVDEARRRTRQAGRLADRIVEQMAAGKRQAARARAQAADQAGPIQGQQDGVRQGVGQLRQDMEAMGSSAFNPGAGRANLETAGEMMERAGTRLGQGRTGPALQSERDALKQLESFRDSMQQARQMMQGEGERMGQQQGMAGGIPWQRLGRQGVDGDPGEVELPDPEDFVSPEAFRALVQEEAGGDAPERYRPLTGSYYEEIVR